MGKQKKSKIHESSRLDLQALLPADELSRSIMAKRARTLSSVGSGENEKLAGMTSYIKFKTSNGEYYGIPYADVMDIKEAHDISPLPNVPGYVSGIHYWNGKIIPIVHLVKYFGISNGEEKSAQYIATVSSGELIIGYLFDDVIGVDSYNADKLDSSLSSISRIKDEYIIGIDKGVITILNVKQMIKDIAAELAHKKGMNYEEV